MPLLFCFCLQPFEAWEGVQRGTAQYRAMKEERAQPLWKVRKGLRKGGAEGLRVMGQGKQQGIQVRHPV